MLYIGTVLHCTVLHCNALDCTEMRCTALYYTALYCNSRYSMHNISSVLFPVLLQFNLMILIQVQSPLAPIQQHSSTTVINVGNHQKVPDLREVYIKRPHRAQNVGLMGAETLCMCQKESIIQEGSGEWSTGLFGCFEDLGSCKLSMEVVVHVFI